MAGLEQVGYREASVLDIGCGVGPLHQSLLEQGASGAVGIDIATTMLSEARAWADERGLGDRVDYVEGDFMTLDEQVDSADICLLDKVVCCYPDADTLVHRSLGKTRRVYALTYPRDRWFVRLAMGSSALFFWLIRSSFRPYVHDPKQIETWIREQDFTKKFQDTTPMWLTQVYVKS